MRRTHALLLAAALLFGACDEDAPQSDNDTSATSEDATDTRSEDTTTPGDSAAGDTTATDGEDASEDVPPEDTQAPGCDFTGLGLTAGEATLEDGLLTVDGRESDTEPADTLYLTATSVESGATLTFDSTPFPNCDPCLVIQPDCADGFCEATFLAVGGTGTVTDAEAPTLEMTLRDLVLLEVTLDEDFNSTAVPEGRSYCVQDDAIQVALPLTVTEVDPCADHPDPVIADKNCGSGNPFIVTFDASGLASNFDRVDSIRWDFGDGDTAFGGETQVHGYAPGVDGADYRATVEISGTIAGNSATITTPELIKVFF